MESAASRKRALTKEEKDEPKKKQRTKTLDNDNDWFVNRDDSVNEVTLRFDDGKELYVSIDFLIYASPVFKAMLTSEFKEKKDKLVKLTGKCYDDVLMFLKCMHPRILLQITSSNVAKIARLAEEYQVDTIIDKCKEVLTIWLRRGSKFKDTDLLVHVPCEQFDEFEDENTIYPRPFVVRKDWSNRRLKQVNVILKVMSISIASNYIKIISECISKLSKISYKYYSGEDHFEMVDAAVVFENGELFGKLPDNLKCFIFQNRLKDCDTK